MRDVHSGITKYGAYIILIRPKHWLKNVLVFVPLIYAFNIAQLDSLLLVVLCFASFCLISSAVYVINDVVDAPKDREHPVKNKRPIASGLISVKHALIIAAFLLIAGFSLFIVRFDNYSVALIAALYFALNVAYSFSLKNYAIVDCFCIATGFVLRVFAGGAASGDIISEWLLLTMIAVSLFMAFGKRRGEIIQINDTTSTRKALTNYDKHFLNGMMFTCAGLSVMFYSLWAMSSGRAMIYTVPLVMFIICKYLLILHRNITYGDPITILLGDKGLIIAVAIFGVLSVALLYM